MDRPIERRFNGHWYQSKLLLLVGGALLIGAASAALYSREPTVDLSTVVVDEVVLGPLEIVTAGPGSLVPIDERVISANGRAMVEMVFREPGAVLTSGETIMRMANQDHQLSLLEAQRELAAAKAELVSLQADLDNQLLDQDARIVELVFEQQDAERVAAAFDDLATNGSVAELDLRRAHDKVDELRERIQLEKRKLTFLETSRTAKLEAQEAKTAQLENIVRFQGEVVASLNVTTPIGGVLQEVPVTEGQWIEPGQLLARVAGANELKVALRMPQTDADEIAVGQPASIDTRIGIVRGRVIRVDPEVQDGAVVVEVALEEELPKGARAQLTVYGEIVAKRIAETLSIHRPIGAVPFSDAELFRVEPDSGTVTRVRITYGEVAGERIEILDGAEEGDRLIVSELGDWLGYGTLSVSN